MVFGQTTEKDSIDTGTTTLIPIGEDVYAVSPNFAGAAGALILNDKGNIVVDSHGSPASARALVAAVETISDQPIRYVINTHWHVDHHSGNAAYKQAYGNDVIFISHDLTRADIPGKGTDQFRQVATYRTRHVKAANDVLDAAVDAHDRPLTESQKAAIERFRDEQEEFAQREEPDFVLADLTFSKSITLHGGPSTVEVFFLHPAHTRSDAIVYLRDQQILMIGDLLTKPILWSWSSYPTGYIATLKELEKLSIRKIVIGHGGPVLNGTSYMTLVRQFLEAAVAFASESHAAGLDEQAAIEAASGSPIEDFRRRFVTEEQNEMFDQMVGWTLSRAYLEIAESNQP